MVARRFLSWPSDIYPVNRQPRSRIFVNRTTETEGGLDSSSEMRTAQKRSYSNQFVIPYEDTALRNKFMWLAPQLRGKSSRIYYPEVSERWYEKIRSGPPCDGSRVAFPVPLISASDGPHIYYGGVWDSAATISSVRCNLLTDNQAIADTDTTGLEAAGTSTISRVTGYRYYYGSAIQCDPTGTVANYGVKTTKVTVVPDWPTTAVFWAIGPEPLEVQARITWFDALDVQIGSTILGTAVDLVPGEWVPAWVTSVAPSNAATAVFRYLTITTSDTLWWCDCRGAMLLGDPWWWLPSEAPLAGLLSVSAPPSPTVVEVAGAGLWQALCAPQSDVLGEDERPQGHIYPDLDLVEVWEPASAW